MKSLALICFLGFSLAARAQAPDCVARMASSDGGRTSTGRSTIVESAKLQSGNRMPGIPAGEPSLFVVSVVVDTAGRADSATIQLPPELDSFSANAIRTVLPTWSFVPAHVGACPMKQVLKLTFTRGK